MNTIQIAGRLGADPAPRVTPKGIKVTTLSVATSIYQNGKDDTIWWRVTVWNDEFKNIIDHLKKGSAVVIVGEMRNKPETYVDKNGVTQVTMTITAISIRFSPFGSPDKASSDGQAQGQRPASNQQQPYGANAREPANVAAGSSYGEAAQYAEAAQDDDQMPF